MEVIKGEASRLEVDTDRPYPKSGRVPEVICETSYAGASVVKGDDVELWYTAKGALRMSCELVVDLIDLFCNFRS
jgi:hypothetical protein